MYWMHQGMGGWGAALMLLNVVVLTAVVFGAVLLVVRPRYRAESQDSDRAGRILAERYARGEIDDEEYRRRLDTLALR